LFILNIIDGNCNVHMLLGVHIGKMNSNASKKTVEIYDFFKIGARCTHGQQEFKDKKKKKKNL
jgi:hypothetical protein